MSFLRKIFSGLSDNGADSVMRVEDGDKIWRNAKGQYHRTDGPAIEWANGDKFWYLNGHLHRTDGPAVESENGNKEWWINGHIHRTNGPAIEWADGTKGWYLNGKELTEQEFNAHPLVLEAQRQKKAEKAANEAEKHERIMQVIRDFHAKIRRPS